jgi:hypothetical protein
MYRTAFEITGSREVMRAEYEEARRLFLARIAVNRAEDEAPKNAPGKIGRVPYVRAAARGEEYALGVYALELEAAIMKVGRKRAGICPWELPRCHIRIGERAPPRIRQRIVSPSRI